VHISAPHMYGCILEALELESNPRTSTSFLNVGSGTGYLSCIVASILGPNSGDVQYGVEIHEEVIEHCHASIEKWLQSQEAEVSSKCNINFAHGNGLNIDPMQGEARIGFDRIYVGATIRSRNLHKLTRLLAPNGILVGPIDSDDLIKVKRTGCGTDFVEESIACVRFASLLSSPNQIPVLPAQVWSCAQHCHYPQSFRDAVIALLICSKRQISMPSELWVEVLSYAHRHWFDATPEVDVSQKTRVSKKKRLLSALHLYRPHSVSRRRLQQQSIAIDDSASDEDISMDNAEESSSESNASDSEVEEEDVNMLAIVMHDMNMAFPLHLLMRDGHHHDVVSVSQSQHAVVVDDISNDAEPSSAITSSSPPLVQSGNDSSIQLHQERRTVSLGEDDLNE